MRRRRDRAVEGFLALKAGGGEALAGFHEQAATLVGPRVESWRQVWAQRPAVHALPPPPAERRYGCCGTLGTYLP